MSNTPQAAVIRHLQDAYAMEHTVLSLLDSLISTTEDPITKSLLQQHRIETLQHIDRVERRLKDLGHPTSLAKTATAVMGSLVKNLIDVVRTEKACKNLRDAFITEHAEIAGYELLERYAAQANDPHTLSLARQNKYEEIEMARRLSQLWDRAVEQDLGKSPTKDPQPAPSSNNTNTNLHKNPLHLDPDSSPAEGAGTEKSASVKFAESTKTDESGAPVQ